MSVKNELLKMIDERYQKFSKGQKKLADFIREDYDKAAFLTAAKMGEEVGVSESTVVRFATALGYDGYPEFQKALGELVRMLSLIHIFVKGKMIWRIITVWHIKSHRIR